MSKYWDDDPVTIYDDHDELECEHEDHAIDTLTGCAECWDCGHRWFATDAEIKRYEELSRVPYQPDEEAEE